MMSLAAGLLLPSLLLAQKTEKVEEPTVLDPITVEGKSMPLRINGTETLIPPYPTVERSRWTQGCVKLRFVVREDGKADDFQILESKPLGAFEKSVLTAAMKWQFAPRVEPLEVTEIFKFQNAVVRFAFHYQCDVNGPTGGARMGSTGEGMPSGGQGPKLACHRYKEPTCSEDLVQRE